MKKILIIFMCMIAMPAFADDWYNDYEYNDAPVVKRDNYVGIRLHKNERISYAYDIAHGGNSTMKDDNFGFGLTVGNRLTNHVKIEFETAYTGSKFNKYSTDFDYDIWTNMLNVYLFHEFGGAVAPYAGLGIGIAEIWGDVHGAGNNMSDATADLSWQAMAGINFALNDRIDLNLGFKYQNYGNIDHKNSNGTFATTKIDATEIYIGAAYKFGLK